MKKIIIVIIGVIFFTYSCKKEEKNVITSKNEQFITSYDPDDPYQYCEANLSIIAKGLSVMSNNQTFTNILHDKVLEQFDGDYNVLFNDLVTECTNNNINLINEMKLYLYSNNIDSSLLSDALNAFDNIDGNKYYIQVYIPYIEDIENFQSTPPVSLAYYGDETKLLYNGYYSDNEILTTSTNIDEDYSQTNEVWIISLNENLDNNGVLITPIDPTTKSVTREIPEPSLHGSSITNMLIYYMKVKERKENWCGGKSEIAIISGDTYHNGLDPQSNPYLEHLEGDNARGSLLTKFTKKQINDGDMQDLQGIGRLIKNWDNTDYYNQTVIYAFTIFERDVWPATKRYTNNIPIINVKFEIRSSDNEYTATALSSMSGYGDFPFFDGYAIDNNGIYVTFMEY